MPRRQSVQADASPPPTERGRRSSVGKDTASHSQGGGRKSSLVSDRLSIGSPSGGSSSKAELVRKLKDFHVILEGLEQDSRPDGLGETAADLASPNLMNHKDREVRLLTACCLVDIFRIYAPNAPYTQTELRSIFALLIQQLRGLPEAVDPTDTRAARVHYVLSSLASVKSCAILVDLMREGVDQAEETLVDFFDCLLTGIRESHLQDVVDNILEALSVCLDEMDDVPQPILDAMLMCLLPVSRNENQKSYVLTQILLSRSLSRVQEPITRFLNGALSVDRPGEPATSESELSEHVTTLILELHKVNPQMLLYVLPHLANKLQNHDVQERVAVVRLLGRLLASSHASYGVEYPQIWSEFLGRFKDLEAEVRKETVIVGVEILQKKEALRKDLVEALTLRFNDHDAEVRSTTVRLLCDCASNCLDAMTEDLLRQMSERTKDKKFQIRKDTVTGLAQVYAKHISRRWPDNDQELTAPVLAALEKMKWIPSVVFGCYAYPEADIRVRVLQLVDDILLPSKASPSVRANLMVSIWEDLDEKSQKGIKKMLEDRKNCQNALMGYLAAREQHGARVKPKEPLPPAMEKALENLQLMAPPPDGHGDLLRRLYEFKDGKMFQGLKVLCGNAGNEKLISAREEVIKKAGSKTTLGEYLAVLTRRCTLLTFGPQMFEHILPVAVSALETEDEKRAQCAVEILSTQAAVFPQQLKGRFAGLVELYEGAVEHSEEPSVMQTSILKLISCAKLNEDGDQEHASRAFLASLKDAIVSSGSVELAETAAAALKATAPPASRVPAEVLRELTSSSVLTTRSDRLPAVLHALATFSLHYPELFQEHDASVTKFVMDKVIAKGGSGGAAGAETPKQKKGKKGADTGPSLACRCLCAGLHLLALRLRALPLDSEKDDEEAITSARAESEKTLKLFFSILKGKGTREGWELSSSDKAEMRLRTAIYVLKLMRNQVLVPTLSAQMWHSLAWVLLDKDEHVRRQFLVEVCGFISHYKEAPPHRFVAYLSLVGAESEAAKREAKTVMDAAVRKMRLNHHHKCANAESDEARNELARHLPEYILPCTIHLLAHLPGTSGTDPAEEGASNKQYQKCLKFVLDALGGAPGVESDNLPFLLEIVRVIRSDYCDRLAPNSKRLHAVADLARTLLHSKIKTQDNVENYPGKIFIPTPLYQNAVEVRGTPSSRMRSPAASAASGSPGVPLHAGDTTSESPPDWGSPVPAKSARKSTSSKSAKSSRKRAASPSPSESPHLERDESPPRGKDAFDQTSGESDSDAEEAIEKPAKKARKPAAKKTTATTAARGRPKGKGKAAPAPKSDKEGAKAKRPRARKRSLSPPTSSSSESEHEQEKEQDEEEQEQENIAAQAEEEPVQPAQKKRGRPRKEDTEVTAASTKVTTKVTKTTIKATARVRAAAVRTENIDENDVELDVEEKDLLVEEEISVEVQRPEKKGKRGAAAVSDKEKEKDERETSPPPPAKGKGKGKRPIAETTEPAESPVPRKAAAAARGPPSESSPAPRKPAAAVRGPPSDDEGSDSESELAALAQRRRAIRMG